MLLSDMTHMYPVETVLSSTRVDEGKSSKRAIPQIYNSKKLNVPYSNRPFIKSIRFTYTMVAYLTIRSRGRDRQLVAAKKMKDKTRERDGVVDEEKTTTTFLCLKSESSPADWEVMKDLAESGTARCKAGGPPMIPNRNWNALFGRHTNGHLQLISRENYFSF